MSQDEDLNLAADFSAVNLHYGQRGSGNVPSFPRGGIYWDEETRACPGRGERRRWS
jgi:hypothetical protein